MRESNSLCVVCGNEAVAPVSLCCRASVITPTKFATTHSIAGKAGKCKWIPYDVLQIRKEQWTDFSTIRTETEARMAVNIVDSGKFMDTYAKFRIVRSNAQTVIYGGEIELAPAKKNYRTQLAHDIRETLNQGEKK